MKIIETAIPDVKIIEPDRSCDGRGWFCEIYNAERYKKAGIIANFVQDNESFSAKGVIRGLHWQEEPYAQAKLVWVIHGAVLDVAVDIRPDSQTYGRHVAEVLSGENCRQLFIPRGFAHGFIVLEDNTLFSYKCDNFYNRQAERGVRFDDPILGIRWPDIGSEIILSDKDRKHPLFKDINRIARKMTVG